LPTTDTFSLLKNEGKQVVKELHSRGTSPGPLRARASSSTPTPDFENALTD